MNPRYLKKSLFILLFNTIVFVLPQWSWSACDEVMKEPESRDVARVELVGDSNLEFGLHINGLDIEFTLGPHSLEGENSPEKGLGLFYLSYLPNKFRIGSLIRRALGAKRLRYTVRDIRKAKQDYLGEHGVAYYFFLRDPSDFKREEDKGPLMIVTLSGRVFFYPVGINEVNFGWPSFVSATWSGIQQRFSRPLQGNWSNIKEGEFQAGQ